MSKTIGRFVQFGIARETSRGTSESAASFWIPWEELAIDDKDERVLNDSTRGIIETTVGESIVKKWAETELTAPIGDKAFPLFLYSLLGSLSTSGPTDSAYTHTFNVGESIQHQALSLFIDDPAAGQDYKFALGMVAGLDIKYEQKKFLSYSVSLRSKQGATATLTPATTTENRYLPHHLTFKIASAQSGLTAASATVLKSANISFKPNLLDDDVLGANAPADFNNTGFEVEGTLELYFDDETEKTLSLAATSRALRFDLINTDVVIGSSTNPSIRIDFYNVTFRPITRAIKQGDLVLQTIAFKAHYSISDSKMLVATVVNAQSSY